MGMGTSMADTPARSASSAPKGAAVLLGTLLFLGPAHGEMVRPVFAEQMVNAMLEMMEWLYHNSQGYTMGHPDYTRWPGLPGEYGLPSQTLLPSELSLHAAGINPMGSVALPGQGQSYLEEARRQALGLGDDLSGLLSRSGGQNATPSQAQGTSPYHSVPGTQTAYGTTQPHMGGTQGSYNPTLTPQQDYTTSQPAYAPQMMATTPPGVVTNQPGYAQLPSSGDQTLQPNSVYPNPGYTGATQAPALMTPQTLSNGMQGLSPQLPPTGLPMGQGGTVAPQGYAQQGQSVWNGVSQPGSTSAQSLAPPQATTTPWYIPQQLAGYWRSRSGETLLIQGERFILQAEGVGSIEGRLLARGDRLVAYNQAEGIETVYRFLHQDDILVLRDSLGQAILFQRESLPSRLNY